MVVKGDENRSFELAEKASTSILCCFNERLTGEQILIGVYGRISSKIELTQNEIKRLQTAAVRRFKERYYF